MQGAHTESPPGALACVWRGDSADRAGQGAELAVWESEWRLHGANRVDLDTAHAPSGQSTFKKFKVCSPHEIFVFARRINEGVPARRLAW